MKQECQKASRKYEELNAELKRTEKKADKDLQKIRADIESVSGAKEFDELSLSTMAEANHQSSKEVVMKRQVYDALAERLKKMNDEEAAEGESIEEKMDSLVQRINELETELSEVDYEREEGEPIIKDWKEKDTNSLGGAQVRDAHTLCGGLPNTHRRMTDTFSGRYHVPVMFSSMWCWLSGLQELISFCKSPFKRNPCCFVRSWIT